MRFSSLVAATTALVGSAKACIQAHAYYQEQYSLDIAGDTMSIQVWVNGRLVCTGTDNNHASQEETHFCLQNGDGKGSQCAPGYSYCAQGHGGNGTFYYWENGAIVYQQELKSYEYAHDTYVCNTYDTTVGHSDVKCIIKDYALSAGVCDNLPKLALCNGKAVCDDDDLPDTEPFNPYPFPFLPDRKIKFMVLGDSISHGHKGDWTWRYRVWQWLKQQGYPIEFVGPYTMVKGDAAVGQAVPEPALLPGETATVWPETSDSYDSGVDLEFVQSGHAAWWGRQAMQDKSLVKGWVAQYKPDIILSLLGFNDLGWFVSDPDGLINSMTTIVDNARSANPYVKMLAGNVVDRLFINGRDDLVANTKTYNAKLKDAVGVWDYDYLRSPIAYVDVNANYDCRPGNCPDGYDGLHPGAVGEFHIAQAFANVLRDTYGYWGKNLDIGAVPTRPLITPTSLSVISDPKGLIATWPDEFYARGYSLRIRYQGMTDWWSEGQVYPNTYRSYFTWCQAGQPWEFSVATIGDHGALSAYTAVQGATCNPSTSKPPTNIKVTPKGSSIQFTWDPVSGYSINRYTVIIYDNDAPGSFINSWSTTGTSYEVTGLIGGHRYSTWVQTWVNLPDGSHGGGPPGGARQVYPGSTTPVQPTGLTAVNTAPTTVKLSWTAARYAAGYEVQFRSLLDSTVGGIDGTTTDTTYEIGFLFPGTWHYEFCVIAYNGNSESACTNWVVPPVYPGYTKRSEAEANVTEAEHHVYNVTRDLRNNGLAQLFQLTLQNATEPTVSTNATAL